MSLILLIEDDESLGLTLKEHLEREGHRVNWAQNLEQAFTSVKGKPYDLVVLDVGLPDGSGFEFAKKVKAFCDSPFMFMTAQASSEDRLQGFELGAEEYIPKPFHLKEFLLRVKHVLQAHRNLRIITVAGTEISFEARTIKREGCEYEHLGAKEFEILEMIVDESPSVVSRYQILNKIWGENQHLSNRSIDNIVLSIRQKLGPAGKCIKSVRGVGYQWLV